MCADKDSRKEDGAAVSRGPVLEEHPEVVPTDEGLETGTRTGAAVVLAELDGLVDRTMAVAQICGEGVADVDAEAFRRAKRTDADHRKSDVHACGALRATAYNPMALA